MAIEFRILGSVQARIGDVVVDVGPARQRCVLAVLLVDANQVVSAHQLADRVWGDRVAHRANGTLRTYLSRLRKALASADDVEIGRRSGGYVLAVDPMTVDLHDFRHLVARARGSVDEDSAAALYEQALRLWRGEPFAGMDAPWLNRIRDALEAERHAAELDHADLRLRRGQHGALLAGLTALAAAHPLDERLAGQLMLAHYRSGRQADALAHYQAIRSQLAEDLGTDPGAPLRELHQQMLTADPTLIAPAIGVTGSGSTHSAVPAQLPADIVTFTGRAAELNHFLAVWPPGHPSSSTVVISAIDGMAGVGKTALAVHAAHQVKDRFPDGQLFVDLHGFTEGIDPTEPADALDTLLRALGKTGEQVPPTLAERAALLRTTLAGRRVLLVLDNAATETQVRPLLPGAPGCLVLITSRRRVTGLDDAHVLSVDVLPLTDGVRLFAAIAGLDGLDSPNSDLAEQIVERCGRLPLAIRLAAARLRARPTWNLTHLLDRLGDHQHRLAELQAGQRSVAASFDLSYHQLTPDQRRLLRLLSLHPGPDIDTHAAAALANTPPVHTERQLEDLLDDHLLEQHAPSRYRFHDLLRAYAKHAATEEETDADRHAALTRLLDHYLHTASMAMDLVYPREAVARPRLHQTTASTTTLHTREQGTVWLDTEHANLLACASYAAEHGWAAHTIALSATLHRHLRTRARHTDAHTLHTQAVQLANATGDQTGEHTALHALGAIHDAQGRYDQAADCFTRALAIARDIGNRTGEHDSLQALGDIHRLQSRYEPAAAYLRQALAIARDTGNRTGEHYAFYALGDIHRRQGRYEPATDCYQQSLAIARDIGSRAGELRALRGFGNVHRLQARYEPAIDCFQRSLAIACDLGDRNAQFEALHGLGHSHHSSGNLRLALDHHHRALILARDLDQPHDQAHAHDALAHTHHALNQPDQARTHWQYALAIYTELGTPEIDGIRTHLATHSPYPASPDDAGAGRRDP